MPINSGFPNNQYEDYYNNLVFRLILVLQKRVLQSYKKQETNEEKFLQSVEKILKSLKNLEEHKYKWPKFSEATFEIEQYFSFDLSVKKPKLHKQQSKSSLTKVNRSQSVSANNNNNFQFSEGRNSQLSSYFEQSNTLNPNLKSKNLKDSNSIKRLSQSNFIQNFTNNNNEQKLNKDNQQIQQKHKNTQSLSAQSKLLKKPNNRVVNDVDSVIYERKAMALSASNSKPQQHLQYSQKKSQLPPFNNSNIKEKMSSLTNSPPHLNNKKQKNEKLLQHNFDQKKQQQQQQNPMDFYSEIDAITNVKKQSNKSQLENHHHLYADQPESIAQLSNSKILKYEQYRRLPKIPGSQSQSGKTNSEEKARLKQNIFISNQGNERERQLSNNIKNKKQFQLQQQENQLKCNKKVNLSPNGVVVEQRMPNILKQNKKKQIKSHHIYNTTPDIHYTKKNINNISHNFSSQLQQQYTPNTKKMEQSKRKIQEKAKNRSQIERSYTNLDQYEQSNNLQASKAISNNNINNDICQTPKEIAKKLQEINKKKLKNLENKEVINYMNTPLITTTKSKNQNRKQQFYYQLDNHSSSNQYTRSISVQKSHNLSKSNHNQNYSIISNNDEKFNKRQEKSVPNFKERMSKNQINKQYIDKQINISLHNEHSIVQLSDIVEHNSRNNNAGAYMQQEQQQYQQQQQQQQQQEEQQVKAKGKQILKIVKRVKKDTIQQNDDCADNENYQQYDSKIDKINDSQYLQYNDDQDYGELLKIMEQRKVELPNILNKLDSQQNSSVKHNNNQRHGDTTKGQIITEIKTCTYTIHHDNINNT